MWAQGAAGDCGYIPLAAFRGPQLCTRIDPPSTVVCWVIEWPTRSDVMIILSTQLCCSEISQVIRVLTGLQPYWPWASDVLGKIQSCHEYIHSMELFQHLGSVLIPATIAPLGFSKHSDLFPQDPCLLECTLQNMICGPGLYIAHIKPSSLFMPHDM